MPDDDPPDPASGALAAVLGLTALTWAIGQTSLVPALPEIGRELGVGPSGVAWTLTAYLMMAAISTPLLGRIGDQVGRRRMLLVCMAALTIGSLVAAVAPSLGVLIAGRVVQGIGAGVFPLCFAILRNTLPPDAAARSVGTISALVGAGGGIGLVAGGLLADSGSFRYIFWGTAAMSVLVWGAVRIVVPDSRGATGGRIDVRGGLVLAVGLSAALLAISRTGTAGWTSAQTLGLLALAALVLAGWWILEARTAEPLADLASLTDPIVRMGNLATLLIGFGVFGSFILIPELAQAPTSTPYGLGLSATLAGLLLVPGSIVMLVLGRVSGALGRRYTPRLPLAAGGAIAAVGLALTAVSHAGWPALVGFGTLLYAGMALSFAAMPNLVLQAVPVHRTGEATGFNALVRLVARRSARR
jgi:MFS family permease